MYRKFTIDISGGQNETKIFWKIIESQIKTMKTIRIGLTYIYTFSK